MTTNVFCKKNNVLASDSRWSYRLDRDGIPSTQAIAYVDDAGFDKIAFDEDTGFLFAGPGDVIEQWRKWVAHPAVTRPAVALNFAICMTDLATGDILMEHGQKVVAEQCRAAGTGAKDAYDCWVVNGDARRAVASAIKFDRLSGGSVKFLNGSDRENNVDPSVDFSSVATEFLKRGMVMYPTSSSSKEVALAEAAKDDPRIAELVRKVAANQLAAEAPSGYDPVVWTPADEARLDEALALRAKKRSLKA